MAAAEYHTIDLDRLALSPGQGKRLELEVGVAALEFGGFDYAVDEGPLAARLEVSRNAAGYAMRLRFEASLTGPCVRCLGDGRVAVAVDSREVDQALADDEELRSPYVSDGVLALADWAHDALALALPQKLLCRPDCAGLCPVCGVSLNDTDAAAHDHGEQLDPRWWKLRELQ